MKKKLIALLAMVLALVLLGGCGSIGELAGDFKRAFSSGGEREESEETMVPFDQMVYTRPDLDAMRQDVEAVKSALEHSSSLRTLTGLLDQCYADYYDFQTMYTIADIRYCQDLTDSYYAEEYAWCDDSSSTVSQLMEEMFYACGMSAKAEELEENYFWEGFAQDYADDSEALYDEELVELMRRESALVTEYRALAASPTIHVDGEEVDYYGYLYDAYDEDYSNAILQYYREYNEEFARIYIDLAKVRRELADKLGFDSYEQMQYYYYFERDYGPEEAAAYLADIKTYIVPLFEELNQGDLYAGITYDYLAEKDLFKALRAGAKRMGGEIESAFQFMADYRLYDIAVSNNKANMSFQTYLDNYEAPFLFLNPYGDVEDITSFSHEFGHYVDAYVNYDAYETIDVSECFSQAMEYLMLGYLDEALGGEDLENLYRIKMLDTLQLYVQQGSFAEFERRVYAADPEELDADFLNDLSLQLAIDYGYYDGESEEYYAYSWTDISHFFEMPFYVITYPVSNDIAMQIYELEQRQEGAGLEKYLEILPREYSGLIDTATAAGLESPFAPGRLQKVEQDLREHLSWYAQAA